MEKFIIQGRKALQGEVHVTGSKNVALKAIVAACLTDEEIVIENVPLISDFQVMIEIVRELGGKVSLDGYTIKLQVKEFSKHNITLEQAALIRTSSMFLSPLLARNKKAIIPNPGGCRIGARPIDRMVEGLKKMGTTISYHSEDGYFYAEAPNGLSGTQYTFDKNTHTGTETLILAAVLAKGETILENAAQEPEVDDLIGFLKRMGADIKRVKPRTIVIRGVEKLHGTHFVVNPDRNEIVTLAIAAVLTKGDIFIKNVTKEGILEFLEQFERIGGGFEEKESGLRFFYKGPLKPVDIMTSPYPGFMTDWQGPWVVLMTQAEGVSVVHETVYENRFGYSDGLTKMGAKIELFNPPVANPQEFYNFNPEDDKKEYYHAIRISGPTKLHNAVVIMTDLRAGATLVLAALAATGTTTIFGVHHLDRGYERFEVRLRGLGADIRRVHDE